MNEQHEPVMPLSEQVRPGAPIEDASKLHPGDDLIYEESNTYDQRTIDRRTEQDDGWCFTNGLWNDDESIQANYTLGSLPDPEPAAEPPLSQRIQPGKLYEHDFRGAQATPLHRARRGDDEPGWVIVEGGVVQDVAWDSGRWSLVESAAVEGVPTPAEPPDEDHWCSCPPDCCRGIGPDPGGCSWCWAKEEDEACPNAAVSVAPTPAEKSKALEPGTPIVTDDGLCSRLDREAATGACWYLVGSGVRLLHSDYGTRWLPFDEALTAAFPEATT